MKYLFANWKANKNVAGVKEWAAAVESVRQHSDLKIVVCPSFVHVSLVKTVLPDFALGTQTLSPFPNGAYTGAVSALMASEFVQFAILGHSERRRYFGETNQTVANQAIQALENHITPVVAVDQTNWSSQLSQFDEAQIKKMLVMYEPPEAISTSGAGAHPAAVADVTTTIQLIKKEYKVMGCLYGGSVDAKNIAAFMNVSDGVVVGAASLDPQEFVSLVDAVNSGLHV